MKTTQGFLLLDVDVAALNNAGNDTSTNLDNAVATKKIYKDGKAYPYVSGQAWRYWWRETLQKNYSWEMSPVIRESKIAFTAANPIKFADDDIFGYMRAAKIEIIDEKTGKTKKENITLTRVSPLKNSALLAVAPNTIVQNWSSMTRQEGDAVPYGKDEYCAVMKGMFSIDLDQVGTFFEQERTGFKNFNQALKNEALNSGAEEIDDPIAKDSKGNPLKVCRLPKEIREKRVTDVVNALQTLSGGAKQTTNLADVTPKFLILVTLNSGNHPFSHIAVEDLGKAKLSIESLKQVLNDYKDKFEGDVFIGRRIGFMDEYEEKIQALANEFSFVKYGSIVEAIKNYSETLNTVL